MIQLGLKGAEINDHVNGRTFEEPEFLPFWKAAEQMGAPDLLPSGRRDAGDPAHKRYHLPNTIGNLVDRAVTFATLVPGGVMDTHPDLKIVLGHGGGYTCYGIGRMDRGWQVRTEARGHQPAAERLSAALLLRLPRLQRAGAALPDRHGRRGPRGVRHGLARRHGARLAGVLDPRHEELTPGREGAILWQEPGAAAGHMKVAFGVGLGSSVGLLGGADAQKFLELVRMADGYGAAAIGTYDSAFLGGDAYVRATLIATAASRAAVGLRPTNPSPASRR